MAYGLPEHGDPNWDVKLNASIEAVKATADAAPDTVAADIDGGTGPVAVALTASTDAQITDRFDSDLAVGTMRVGRRDGATLHDPGYTQTTLIEGADPGALSSWNSNPTPARWQDRWWIAYDNNRSGGTGELDAGQKIALLRSASDDIATLAEAGEPFSDAALCTNPRSGDGQFQPNFVHAGDEHPLLCMWNISDLTGFVSKLSSPTGKWTNYRLEWNGTTPSLNTDVQPGDSPAAGCSLSLALDGSTWSAFFPSNPIVLSDGTIAAPVSFTSTAASSDSVSTESTFRRKEKFAAVLYFDADGAPLFLSERVPLTSDVPGYASWEPYLVEALDGTLRMFIRNLATSSPATNATVLAVSESRNRCAWTPARATEVLTASQRANAVRAGSRWISVAMDYPAGLPGNEFQGRFNPVLFVSRTGQDDFVPGNAVGDVNTNAIYPQAVVHENVAYVVWYRQRNQRNDLMLTTIDIPADDAPHVYPRRYHEIAGKGPGTVTVGGGSARQFTGIQRATASTAPLTHASHTWTAWLNPRSTQGVVADNRGTSSGTVLHCIGLSINALNLLHGVTMTPGAPLFLAASVDSTNRLLNVWASSSGGALTKVSAYVRTIKLNSNPADGDTIVVNGVTYTFKNTPSAGTDVQIGASTGVTTVSLAAKLRSNSMVAGIYNTVEIICARTDGADFTATAGTASSINTDIPDSLMAASVNPRVGQRTAASTLMPLDADVYQVKAWDNAALTDANIKSVYNDWAATLGLAALSGDTAPAAASIDFTAASTTATWPDIDDNPQGKATSSGDVLTINGEASASVELPYPGTAVSFVAQLGATPTGSDKYVLATFGTASHAKRLYIEGSAPTSLKLDGTVVQSVPDPTRPFQVEVAVTKDSVIVGSTVQRRTAPGYPRMFLGQAFAESLLAYSKTTTFDTSKLSVAEYRERPLDTTISAEVAAAIAALRTEFGKTKRASSSQTITTATNTDIVFDTEVQDDSTMVNLGTDASRVWARRTGIASVAVLVPFAANTTGRRVVGLKKNGSTIASVTCWPGNGGTVTGSVTWMGQVTANDYFQVYVYQNSGGDLDALHNAGELSLAVEVRPY